MNGCMTKHVDFPSENVCTIGENGRCYGLTQFERIIIVKMEKNLQEIVVSTSTNTGEEKILSFCSFSIFFKI